MNDSFKITPISQAEEGSRITLPAAYAADEYRLLGKIIIDDQRVHAVVAEPFAHGAAGEGRQILQRRGIGCGRSDKPAVL